MQELCRATSSKEQQQNLTDIGTITMKLMQGYALEEGKVGVEDLGDWQESSILDFLSAITSSDRAGRLRKVGYNQSFRSQTRRANGSRTFSSYKYGRRSLGGRKRFSAISSTRRRCPCGGTTTISRDEWNDFQLLVLIVV